MFGSLGAAAASVAGAGASLPTLAFASAVAQAEGASGTTAFTFTLNLTRNGFTAAIPYTWAVAGSGASPAAASDFVGGVLPSGAGTFAAGESTKTITVNVAGDSTVEPDENFVVTATALLALASATAIGTITNDDDGPVSTNGIIAANRTDMPTTAITFATSTTARRVHYASPEGSVSNLRTVDIGFYTDTADATLKSLPGPYIIKRYIEYPVGTFTQVTWSGSPTVSVAAGATIVSDPAAVTIPAGAAFYERTVHVTGSTTTLPVIVLPAGSSTLGLPDGKSLSDLGNSGTVAADNSVNSFGACAILGDVAKANARSFLVIGDSLAFGQGDVSSVGAKGGSGWIGRGLDPLYPYAKLAVPGQGAQTAATDGADSRIVNLRSALGYTDVIAEHGINDLRLGRSQAQVSADQATIRAQHSGKRIYQTTLTPRTSSTDNWATAANQTAKTDGNMAALSSVNDAIRLPSSGVTAVIDVADSAMTARNSGVWSGPYPVSSDGTHVTSAKNASMATIIATLVG